MTMNYELTQMPAGHLRIWDQPIEDRNYVIGADVAEGKVRDKTLSARRKLYSYSDQKPDYSAACVVELETGQHVASWHGYLSPYDYATTLHALGMYYNTAMLVVEINGPGLGTITTLAEGTRYPNLYRTRQYAMIERQDLAINFGWRTLPHTRPQLMQRIHEALATRNVFTRDRQLIDELRTMETDDNGQPRARGANKDDRVFAFALALQGRYDVLGGHHQSNFGFKAVHRRDYSDRCWEKAKAQLASLRHDRTHAGTRRYPPRMVRPAPGMRL